MLWGPLLAQGFKIHFAHQTFRWNNEARGVAAVHCIIVGFADFDVPRKQLFTYTDERGEPILESVANISPYLLAGPSVIAEGRSTSITGAPAIVNGSIPADGGNLILELDEAEELVRLEPAAAKWLRPYVGAEGFISNEYRKCLWLVDCSPTELKGLPHVLERVQRVRDMRLASAKIPTRDKANTPTLFTENRQPKSGSYLAIPRTSSENRPYIPMGVLSSEVIAANDLQLVPNSTLFLFGVLSSAMHNAWIRVTSGRMKSDIRYSVKYTYNTFPWPASPSTEQKSAVELAAQGVLDARAQFGPSLTLPAGEGVRADEGSAEPAELHGLKLADPMLYARLSEHARSMRKAPTPAEAALWQALRGDSAGTHFRRQHVLGRFIVDFVSLDKRLVIEVDGDIHDHQQQEDSARTAWLNGIGFEVLRFRNEEVLAARDQVVDRIRSVAGARTSLRSAQTLPTGEGRVEHSSPVGGGREGASLADLYDPLTMPPALLKAHQALDKAVDKCYRPQPFASDAKRVEYLFELYEEYTKGLLATEKPKRGAKKG